MAETALTDTAASTTRPVGWRGIAADWLCVPKTLFELMT
jgi:hypothetical protein